MKSEFYNQVVFITGAASGIGQAQAFLFLQKGAYVFACDQKENYTSFCKEYPTHFSFFTGDLAKKEVVKQAVQKCIETFSTIDILLNTCGQLDDYKPLLETKDTLWDHIMQTNLYSMFFVTKQVLPIMLQQKHGVIINMASIASLVAGGGGISYTTSKHAIAGFTKQLALDYADQHIQINAIAPGAVQTPMNAKDFAGDGSMAKWVAEQTPTKRWAKAEEIAQVTLFLASKQSSYLQGVVLPVDGGWILK